MTESYPLVHSTFVRAVRGAVIAQAAMGSDGERTVGWAQVREAWTRPQRNHRQTPWSGLFGRAATRTSNTADMAPSTGAGQCGNTMSAQDDRVGPNKFAPNRRGAMPIYLDEHRYYYALPAGIETPLRFQEGMHIWRYVGQQVFSNDPKRPEPRWVDPPTAPVGQPEEDADSYFGVDRDVAIDAWGRRWLLEAIDLDESYALKQRYAARVREQFGMREGPHLQSPRRALRVSPQTPDPARFQSDDSHSENSCGQLVNSEFPLEEAAQSFNDRARKVVNLTYECDKYMGSGTMVDDRHVLTAAHLLTHSEGGYLDHDKAAWCTYGNCSGNASSSKQYEIQCYSVGWTHVRSAYHGEDNTGADWDYGISTLDDVIEGKYRFGWMALESDEWYLGKIADHHRGYPGDEDDCNSNNRCSSAVISDLDLDACSKFDPSSRKQFYAMGMASAVWTGQVEFTTSTANGMSGGPHYNCPTGDCDDGHYLTAVHSGHQPTYSYGPKATAFRSWVVGYAFNYE